MNNKNRFMADGWTFIETLIVMCIVMIFDIDRRQKYQLFAVLLAAKKSFFTVLRSFVIGSFIIALF